MDTDVIISYSKSAVLIAYTIATAILLICLCLGRCNISFKEKGRRKKDCEETSSQNKYKQRFHEAEVLVKQLQLQLQNERLQKDDALKRFHEAEAHVKELRLQLQNERLQKDDALKRLSAIMSSKLKDGNPNVVDLGDQNRPTKLGEQFSELYDNQWTNAYDAIENFFRNTKEEPEIIQILLNILEQCFTECKERSKVQFHRLHENVKEIASSISKKSSAFQVDLMQRIKEERKLFFIDNVPEFDEILPRLKITFPSKYQDQHFLDEPSVKVYVQECLKLSWLMVIQDPQMTIIIKPESDAYEYFREYKTRGNILNYVVWPVLLLHEGGPIIMKGCAEFSKTNFSKPITETLISERL